MTSDTKRYNGSLGKFTGSSANGMEESELNLKGSNEPSIFSATLFPTKNVSRSSTIVNKKFSDLSFRSKNPNDEEYKPFAKYSPIKASERVQQNLDRVIFPNDKWIKRWDFYMIILLFFNLIIMPYEAGVSYFSLVSIEHITWYVINETINVFFIIDTFLYFQRPYRGKDGRWVIDLRMIRKNYLKGMFIFDFLSVMPVTLFLLDNSSINYFTIVCKFLRFARFARIPRLLSASEALVNFKMKCTSHWLNISKFTVLILISAHILACIWCSIPFLENGCDIDKVEDENNWISHWYAENKLEIDEGKKNIPYPFGPENHGNRYVISLFWAIQTITSIGYGNIPPVTLLEWSVSCFLQVCACIGWAYFLGGLIHVVIGLNKDEEEFGGRSDEVNTLISAMNEQGEGYEVYGCDEDQWEKVILKKKLIAKRIRACLYEKYKLSSLPYVGNNYVGLGGSFPILNSLPSNLREHASILLLQKYLNCVPYLSSRFFTMSDQSDLCWKCTLAEYPAGEVVHTEEIGGKCHRGIWLVLSGCACYARDRSCLRRNNHRSILSSGAMVGAGRVLLEDDHPFIGGRMFFLTYSTVLFVPRRAIQKILKSENGRRAWKECGRWVYARTVLSKSDISQAY